MTSTVLDAPTADAPITTEPPVAEPVPVPKRSPGKKSSAAKPKAKPAKAKSVKAKPPGAKAQRDAEFPWLADAVRSARHLSGMKPGSGGDATVSYSGPGQHLLVRRIVTEIVGEPVTVEKILAASGIKSAALLRKIATWESDKSEMTPMRDLGKRMVTSKGTPDAWASGRYLASILTVWVEELRRDGRAAKKSS